ncbi:MAG TPA: hypothetical protein VJ206_00860 [bacterium]|nr:hypothetical protein [bacterium]
MSTDNHGVPLGLRGHWVTDDRVVVSVRQATMTVEATFVGRLAKP